MEKWLLPNEKQNFFFANNLWNEKKCKIAFPETNILFENKFCQFLNQLLPTVFCKIYLRFKAISNQVTSF
jgi:hypothetical protein